MISINYSKREYLPDKKKSIPRVMKTFLKEKWWNNLNWILSEFQKPETPSNFRGEGGTIIKEYHLFCNHSSGFDYFSMPASKKNDLKFQTSQT